MKERYEVHELEWPVDINKNPNLSIQAIKASEIYDVHGIKSIESISRILHVDPIIVERLIALGRIINKNTRRDYEQ